MPVVTGQLLSNEPNELAQLIAPCKNFVASIEMKPTKIANKNLRCFIFCLIGKDVIVMFLNTLVHAQ